MEIRQTRVYRGPSTWARVPVIDLLLDLGEFEHHPSNVIPDFNARLVAAVPTLASHGCSFGQPGGFLRRLETGTWLGHVVEHVALELQILAGNQVARGKTRAAGETGVYHVVYQYRHEDVGLAAGRVAVDLVKHLAAETEPDPVRVASLLTEVGPVAETVGFGPSTGAIVAEAERHRIPVSRPDPALGFVILGQGASQRRIWATVTAGTGLVAAYVAADKGLTNRLLRDAGVPTPAEVVVVDEGMALEAAGELGYPVVVKPIDGNHGRGVSLDVADAGAVRVAFAVALAASKGGKVVVQRQVVGSDFRALVVGGKVVAVAERVPAHVTGDGVQTVRELVERANADPRRGEGHGRPLTRIQTGEGATGYLTRQGLSWDDVPGRGQRVGLARTANLSTGGTAIDRTDAIHPNNVALARDAAQVVGLDVAGVDIVTTDITRPLAADGGAVVEVNAAPGFRMHTHPSEGEPRPVARAVVEALFPSGSSGRVPIVAVTGTNGKTTTTRMVAHLLRAAGHRVGLTTTDGTYLDDRLLMAGDNAGPASARAILRHPGVDAAALEVARGGILREGLGFDRCDVAIVTNVSADHLGLGGVETLEDLARVKEVVPAATLSTGASVLNVDDPLVAGMVRYARGEVVYFGADAGNGTLRGHLRSGGRAALLRETPRGDMLCLIRAEHEDELMLASAIPATFGGLLRVNAMNALAAAAAAWALGIPVATIREGLSRFGAGFDSTPGRFNLLDVEGRHVLIDYAHNVAALEAVGDFVRRFPAPRSVAMLAIPGDRSNEDTTALGRVAGGIFDGIVIREAANTRGRPRGESAHLLREAVLAAGLPPHEVRVVLDEVEAAHATVDHAGPGDLAVIFVTRPAVIWEEMSRRAARLASRSPLAAT